MPLKIKIAADSLEFQAELNDSPTSQKIIDALPITAKGQRWGGEIYFAIPVSSELEPDSGDVLEAGQLGFWPTGSAFCIFFGPTPASQADEIRAASNVNIIGEIISDRSKLWDVADGAVIKIKKV